LVLVVAVLSRKAIISDEQKSLLLNLKELHDLGVYDRSEYIQRRDTILDEYFAPMRPAQGYRYYRKVLATPNASNWTMPVIFTPQTDWLLKIFNNNMPRSYDDVLPYGDKSYWKSHVYISEGAQDFNGTRLPFDSQIAIQERALSHVGLNLYDGGIWGVALAVCGMAPIVDIYHRNVLYTSSTGANPIVGGLKSVRAWEPNPDPKHPPDPFYYGMDKIKNTELPKVTLPYNMSFVMFKEGCGCPTSGCCEQIAKKEIPGNFFYRMIGPNYIMEDPLEGHYGYEWRAKPAGNNSDPAQWWNLAGIIHWNDWKPITGENVWGCILGPMQVLFIRNCSHVPVFKTFDKAPAEVQLAVSILPAAEALLSKAGSMYHCPEGTKMFPPDEDEATNVSNENNFSAYASYKALMFILLNYYTGSDTVLSKAKDTVKKLIDGLDKWFGSNLLPAKIAGENVISQGGHVTFGGVYHYQKGKQSFAVDCQTWGLLVLGQPRFDKTYGGKQTAYGIWQAVKKLAGYYIDGEIAGVGYTTPADNKTTKTLIWSGEWTWGAVFMLRRVSAEYEKSGKGGWAAELKKDADTMVKHMQKEVVPCDDGVWCDGGLVQKDGSYLYANKRFFIPWGWYANPIGATSSTAWAVLNDFNFNPFQLGGGNATTFWKTQCVNNTPTTGIFEKLEKFYAFSS